MSQITLHRLNERRAHRNAARNHESPHCHPDENEYRPFEFFMQRVRLFTWLAAIGLVGSVVWAVVR